MLKYNIVNFQNCTRDVIASGYMTKPNWRLDMNILARKVSGIYEIRNTINGHCYIGSSVNIQKRWNEHIRDLSANKHHSIYLQRAWNKYGLDCFEFNVIEQCFFFALILREQYYINSCSPEYNIAKDAKSPMLGRPSWNKGGSSWAKGKSFSDEHKRKMSEASRGKSHTSEHTQKIADAKRGKHPSDETRKKMSDAGKAREHRSGYKLSEETRKKISLSLLGNKYSVGRISPNKGKTGLPKASDETRRKMSETRKGKAHSEEAKKNMSDAKKKWWEKKKHVNE